MKNKIYKITIINVTATLRYSLVLLPKNMSDQNLKPKTCTETRLLPLQHQWLLSSWDKVFTDPLLQKSIIEFRNNLDIRIAMRKFSRCRSYYEARKGLLPYPTATTDWTHQTISKIVNQVRFTKPKCRSIPTVWQLIFGSRHLGKIRSDKLPPMLHFTNDSG
jgi:hypothetical protein